MIFLDVLVLVYFFVVKPNLSVVVFSQLTFFTLILVWVYAYFYETPFSSINRLMSEFTKP